MIEEALATSPSLLPPGFGELEFDTTASFGQDMGWWTTSSPDCLVLCLPPDDLMQGYFLTKLRNDVPRALPLLILSQSISAAMMSLSQIFTRVRLLKAPAEGHLVVRNLVELLTHWEPGKQQAHPRYMTDQIVVLNNDYQGRMKNLSLSGAYVESENVDLAVKSGDLIKMKIQAGNPPKDYVFDARVVWSKPLQTGTGNCFGVAFVNREEVYNQLLKGF